MQSSISRFLREDSGVTAIEYGLIAALIAVLLIAVMVSVGSSLRLMWLHLADCLASPTSPTC